MSGIKGKSGRKKKFGQKVYVRVIDEDFDELTKQAKIRGLDLSTYIRIIIRKSLFPSTYKAI